MGSVLRQDAFRAESSGHNVPDSEREKKEAAPVPATKRFFVGLEKNALLGVRRAQRHREGEEKWRLILHGEPAAGAASVTGT